MERPDQKNLPLWPEGSNPEAKSTSSDPKGSFPGASLGDPNSSVASTNQGSSAINNETLGNSSLTPDVERSGLDSGGGVSAKLDKTGKKGPIKPTVIGYEILSELGRGGMGVVYKARQLKLNRVVALKMVLSGGHSSPNQLARFLTEAEAVAQLHHPNIVQIYDIGENDGLPYFSLEFVNGGSLSQKIGGKPLPVRQAAEITRQIATAIESAHKQGVIHRDLKPANILLAEKDVPKITDFGLAKLLEGDSSKTKSGMLMGTPSYMAPELVQGGTRNSGPLADLYAIGVILYEMLTGRPPFVGTSIVETLQQVEKLEPVPPRQLVPSVPVDLETICLKCLRKEPNKRYVNPEALAKDLTRFLAGDPIEARPIGQVERFSRWCRRNPQVAALSIAVFGLLVTVAVTSTVLLVRINEEKKQTENERTDANNARDLALFNETRAKEALIKAEDAEKAARENAKLAEDQGRLAVNTLYQVVTKVQQRLRTQPGTQKMRTDLLIDAFDGLTKVVASTESSSLVSRTKAAAHQIRGDISKELGRTKEALKEYLATQKIIDTLAAADPENELTIFNQAVVYEKLGDINHQLLGDGAVARENYRKCLELRSGLAGKTLKAPELQTELIKRLLSGAFRKQGYLSFMLGDPNDAWANYQKFLEIKTDKKKYESPKDALAAVEALLATREPKSTDSILSAGFALRLGDVAFHLGDIPTSWGWYKKALELGLDKVKKDPNNDMAKQDLAACYGAIGDLDLQTGDPAKARDYYSQAHQIILEIKARNPENADLQRNLSQSFYHLGTVFGRLGEHELSDKHFQSCLQLREGLSKLEAQNAYNEIDLGLILARCGKQVQAADLIDKLRARAPKDPAILFFTACTYALCATDAVKDPVAREKYANVALGALAQAISNGYRDGVALDHDPDLDSIRKDMRFREIVEKLKNQKAE